jgi:hypothetical protein
MRSFAIVLAAVLSACAPPTPTISTCPNQPDAYQSVSLGVADAVLVQLPDGSAAVIQFTAFGESEAEYRWRFRPSPKEPTIAGVGRVFEDYFRIPLPGDRTWAIRKNSADDLVVKAGRVRVEWSYRSRQAGWLYYCSGLATLETLDSALFETKL